MKDGIALNHPASDWGRLMQPIFFHNFAQAQVNSETVPCVLSR